MVADWNNSLVKHPEVITEGYNIKSQSLLIIK
jgi:hypothetical protein